MPGWPASSSHTAYIRPEDESTAKLGRPPLRIGWPLSGSDGPGKLRSSGAITIAFFDHVTPWSEERITATLSERNLLPCVAPWMKPSTRSCVVFGRTLMMSIFVPTPIGLKREAHG
jgi:hypothetical protein